MTTEPATRAAEGAARSSSVQGVWPKRRRASRWVARVLLLLVLAVAVGWQASASVQAVTAVAVLLGGAWLFGLVAVPHRKPIVVTPWLLLALGAWTLLHVVPLPHPVVALLSPTAAKLSDAALAATGQGPAAWLALAIAPGDAALQAAVYLLAYAAAVLLGITLMGSGGRTMLHGFVNCVVGVASVLGLLHLTQIGVIPGDIVPTFVKLMADKLCYINTNHLAGVLNLALALALGQAVHAESNSAQMAYALVALALSSLVFAAESRGGMIVMVVVVLGAMASTNGPAKNMRVNQRERALAARWRAAVVMACIVLMAAAFGLPIIEREFGMDASGTADAKVTMLAQAPEILLRTSWVGWGPGGFPVVAGMTGTSPVRHDFAENLIIERIAGDGLWVTLLLFALAGIMVYRSFGRTDRISPSKPFRVAAAGFFVANMVDFSFEMLGPLIAFAGCLVVAEHFYKLSPREKEKAEQYRTRNHIKMMATVGLALAASAWLLTTQVPGRMTRGVDKVLDHSTLAEARQIVPTRFGYDAHALYRLGRQSLLAGHQAEAGRLLDLALTLWPGSAHARLFRFATRLEGDNRPGAADDLRWLLNRGGDGATRALEVCAASRHAEGLLVEILPTMPDKAMEISKFFEVRRPDLIEAVAVALRKRHPDRRFAIDALRAQLYLKRGAIDAARSIAAGLLARPETALEGYYVEGHIFSRTGKPYEAFHMFKEVCAKRPTSDACGYAAWSILGANRPEMALEYLRALQPLVRERPHTSAQWWSWMADAYTQVDKWDETLEAARNAYNLAPQSREFGLQLGGCLIHLALFGEAAELADKLMAEYPDDKKVAEFFETVQTTARPLTFGARRAAELAATRPPADVTPASRPAPVSVDRRVPDR